MELIHELSKLDPEAKIVRYFEGNRDGPDGFIEFDKVQEVNGFYFGDENPWGWYFKSPIGKSGHGIDGTIYASDVQRVVVLK